MALRELGPLETQLGAQLEYVSGQLPPAQQLVDYVSEWVRRAEDTCFAFMFLQHICFDCSPRYLSKVLFTGIFPMCLSKLLFKKQWKEEDAVAEARDGIRSAEDEGPDLPVSKKLRVGV